MMLGTPANNSIAVPKGCFNQAGQISVRNRAIPKLIGKAISKARPEVISVPAIAINAPYSLLTGSHSMRVIKPGPKCWKAGQAPIIYDNMIPANTNKTSAAKVNVIL